MKGKAGSKCKKLKGLPKVGPFLARAKQSPSASWWITLATLLLCLLLSARLDAKLLGCPAWPGQEEGMRNFGELEVQIIVVVTESGNGTNGRCQATVTDQKGNRLFFVSGEALTLEPISGSDLNHDGSPDVVIRKDDDNAYIYYIVSKGLLLELRSGFGITFEKGNGGQTVLVVPDEGFRGFRDFTDVYHYDRFVPVIRFVLEGHCLRNVSAHDQEFYDEQVRKARKSPTQRDFSDFRKGTMQSRYRKGLVKGNVLSIILSYLYSGREDRARAALEELWPPSDQKRIWDELLSARSKGSINLGRCAKEAQTDQTSVRQ